MADKKVCDLQINKNPLYTHTFASTSVYIYTIIGVHTYCMYICTLAVVHVHTYVGAYHMYKCLVYTDAHIHT